MITNWLSPNERAKPVALYVGVWHNLNMKVCYSKKHIHTKDARLVAEHYMRYRYAMFVLDTVPNTP